MTTMFSPDDATLAQGVASGDGAALAAVYDRYAGRLLAFCHGMLRRQADAEDCLQDVFIIAATRLGDLREPALLRSWLFSVARHECLGRLDRRKREVLMDDMLDQAGPADDSPASAAFDAELAALLQDATDGLSDRDRLLLELADRQELSGDELADAIGVPRATAYTLVARARTAARKSLGALLVARTGRQQCAELDAILGEWDGELTPLRRKQINRHIDRCEVCTRHRDRVATPAALLGEGRAFAAELVSLRLRILTAAAAAAAIAATTGRGELEDWIDGWPPADAQLLEAGRNGRRWAAPLVVLVVLLLAVGGAVGLLAIKGTPTPVAAPVPSTTTTPATAARSAPTAPPVAPPTAAPIVTATNSVLAPPAPRPVPTAVTTPAPRGPWTLTVTTNNLASAVVTVGRSSATCERLAVCTYTVADGRSVNITAIPLRNQRDTFSAPASCTSSVDSCSFTITADENIRLQPVRGVVPQLVNEADERLPATPLGAI
jgi:RNA polymerase sigma factor (sigma-70 family)